MINEYFAIIRKALSENRVKHQGIYYESHHIVPDSLEEFGKKSSTVLLTAQEHFRCHKILYLFFKDHPLYSKPTGFSYHAMATLGVKRGDRKLRIKITEDEYTLAKEVNSKLVSENNRLRFSTEESRTKQSLKVKEGKQRMKIENPEKWKDQIEKLSLARSKQVDQYDLDGVFVKTWCSVKEASEQLGISYQGINTCARGKSGRAGKYMWRNHVQDPPKKISSYSDFLQPYYAYRSNLFSKAVDQLDSKGTYMKTWKSAKIAGLSLCIDPGAITTVCKKKKHRKTAGSFIWRYTTN